MAKASMYFNLNGLHGNHGEKEIKQQLDKIPGVLSVSVTNDRKRVAVDFDTTGTNREQLRKKIDEIGLEITGEKFDEHIM